MNNLNLLNFLEPVNIVLNNNSVQTINIASSPDNIGVQQQYQTFFNGLIPLYNSNGITIITIDINMLNTFLMPFINLLNECDNTILNQHNVLFQNLITNITKTSLFSYTGIILVNSTNSKVEMIIPNILFTKNNTQLIDYIINYVYTSMNSELSSIDTPNKPLLSLDKATIDKTELNTYLTSYKSFINQIVIANPTCGFANFFGLLVRIILISYIMQYIYIIQSTNPTDPKIINNIPSIVIKLFNNLIFNINYKSNILYDPNLMNFMNFNPSMCESNESNKSDEYNISTIIIITLLCCLLFCCFLIILFNKK